MRNSLFKQCFAVVSALHVVSAAAFGQAPARLTGEDNAVVTWVVALALVGVVSIAALLNPKRSHHR